MADDTKISSRSLVDSDIGPLRRVTGIFDSITREDKPADKERGYKASTQISLNLKDIEVLEAVEPYHFPIFTTRPCALSNRVKSRCGVLLSSFNTVADMQYMEAQLDKGSPEFIKPSERMDIEDARGKRIGLVMADGIDGRPEPPMLFDGRANEGKGGDVPTPTWAFYMIEDIGQVGGSAEVSPMEKAMQLLDGKTLAEFNTAAIADQSIRGDAQLLQSIGMPPSAKGSFSTTMLSSKQFTKKDDVYHRVAQA